jgi:hypothetical protein
LDVRYFSAIQRKHLYDEQLHKIDASLAILQQQKKCFCNPPPIIDGHRVLGPLQQPTNYRINKQSIEFQQHQNNDLDTTDQASVRKYRNTAKLLINPSG